MGCINSTKKIGELRDVAGNGNVATLNGISSTAISNGGDINNVYRVRAVRLQPDMPMCRNGYLELTPREIVFLPVGSSSGSSAGTQNVPVIWSLQHLRRYGVNGETFSFEAGRRCMSGPGIFIFRLPEADTLYQLFQRYINDVTTLTDDMFPYQGHNIENTSSYNLSRAHAHTNNYLEPTTAQRSAAAARSDYFGSNSPMSIDLDSPDSLPSLSFGGNEVVHFSHNSRYTPQMQSTAEHLSLQTTGNIYSERPMGSSQYQLQQRGHNHNNNNYTNRSECSIYGGGGVESTTASAFSTMSRKLMVRRSSMDIPPKECAPLLLTPTTPTLRLYANIEQWADGQISMAADNCYENINRSDFPLLKSAVNYNNNSSNEVTNNNPTTPGVITSISRMASIVDPESMSLGSGGENSLSCAATTSGMNYIVLDLDHPRSPAATGATCLQYSPKTPLGSAFTLPMANNNMTAQHSDENSLILKQNTNKKQSISNSMITAAATTISALMKNTTTLTTASTAAAATSSSMTACTATPTTTGITDNMNDQMDYSTIDFVRTSALIESSVNGMDFNIDGDIDEDESRITRHGKRIRKAYSISE